MTVSRSSASAALALAAALVCAQALAQTTEVGPPRQLLPLPEPIDVEPAPRVVPPASPILAPDGLPPAPEGVAAGVVETGIQVENLKALDPSSVGILDESQGGLGIDMWAGTPRSLVERLLPRLPTGTPSRAMQKLMQRLLLSTARVPEGTGSGPGLLGLRVERLVAAGDMEAVRQLLHVAPAHLDDGVLARADVASRLLAGDNAGACTRTEAMVRLDDDAYWLKVLAFCKALGGEHAAAAVGVELLREQGADDDRAFSTLIEALAGDDEAVIDSLIAPTALHLAMLRAARRTIPADAIEGASPAILRTIATSPNASLEVRLVAAERAEAAGTLSADALGRIYASIAFSPEEMGNALTVAESDHGPSGRALLYQVAEIEGLPTARASVLQKAWLLARESGGFGTAARVSARAALALEPSPELAWAAADAGRALLAAGEVRAARGWLEMAVQQASLANPEASFAALSLWPLIAIADAEEGVPWSPEILLFWVQGQQELPEATQQQRLSLMFSLLDGLGYTPDRAHWEALLDGPLTVTTYMPSPALWLGLEVAAAGRRVGETVLLALLALGDLGPSRADPVTLRVVTSSLRQVGLEAEARALALEAALTRGL